MGPYGCENFKTLLLLQITTKSFQTCPEFYSQRPSESYVGDFLNFKFPIFHVVFLENFKFTIVTYWEIKNLNYLQNKRW